MTWFEKLMGFQESTIQQVQKKIDINGDKMTSLVNGNSFMFGRLETPSLAELRDRVRAAPHKSGRISVREIVANVHDLHAEESNSGALFQVASQFNLLEMTSSNITPEHGIGIYENDYTQGPTCAIACGAGTIYRNYFARVNNRIGQTLDNQIDCLSKIGVELNNSENRLWEMKNGYALATYAGLIEISNRLNNASEVELDNLRQQLHIGIQWNTQVTLNDAKHAVTQAYCSALPVAYSNHPADLWQPFAQLILEASYEATICTAILNASVTGNNSVFLTLLGGGVFGNKDSWIINGIKRALLLYKDWDLNIEIVSFSKPNPLVTQLIEEFS